MRGVYVIMCLPTAKIYVGSSNNFERRWLNEHIPALRSKSHFNPHLQRAWNKHGEEQFVFQVVHEMPEATALQLVEAEAVAIGLLDPEFNIVRDPRVSPFALLKGKPLPDSQKEAIRRALKGRLFTPEHRAKISAGLKGQQFSKERREKMSKISEKLWKDPEHRAKQIKSRKRAMTPERRAKHSRMLKGRKHSDEHRKKISKGLKKAWHREGANFRASPTAEDLEKRSEIAKNLWKDPEYRAKNLAARKNKKRKNRG